MKRQTGLTDQFDIRWYRENTTGVVEDLGTDSPKIRLETVDITIS